MMLKIILMLFFNNLLIVKHLIIQFIGLMIHIFIWARLQAIGYIVVIIIKMMTVRWRVIRIYISLIIILICKILDLIINLLIILRSFCPILNILQKKRWKLLFLHFKIIKSANFNLILKKILQ